jgi:Ca2+-dependent lipid-binding protein
MDVHIRKYAQEFVVDPVVETGIYASGDLLCAKITLNPIWNETSIEKITVVDLAFISCTLYRFCGQ